MKALMSWSGGHFDLVEQKKKWIMVASAMVRDGVIIYLETFLKKLKSRWDIVHVSRCCVEIFWW